MSVVVCALYRFVALPDFRELRESVYSQLESAGIRGTILLAQEGLNGTIAGSAEAVEGFLAFLKLDPRFQDIDYKLSYEKENPFYRTKVKLKREIVTMGVEGIDPTRVVGTYVEPKDWNALISDPEVVLIDTRNQYEVGLGTFKGAIDPGIDTFREFPDYVGRTLDPAKHKKVAMFCTGGIRCEKSTAYLKEQGFDEVYHLKGGILKYLEEVPEEETLWQGDCFVFDNRVAVNHRLEKGEFELCHGCRQPISAQDKAHPQFEEGVQCPQCFDRHTPEQLARFRERQRQLSLARQRGQAHIGAEVSEVMETNRQRKRALTEKQRQNDAV